MAWPKPGSALFSRQGRFLLRFPRTSKNATVVQNLGFERFVRFDEFATERRDPVLKTEWKGADEVIIWSHGLLGIGKAGKRDLGEYRNIGSRLCDLGESSGAMTYCRDDLNISA